MPDQKNVRWQEGDLVKLQAPDWMREVNRSSHYYLLIAETSDAQEWHALHEGNISKIFLANRPGGGGVVSRL